jgi:hypothetical protein
VRQPGPELEVGVANLLVLLERDVAADHVVEEDAEAPDGRRDAVVTAVTDPLGRRVNSSS